MEGQSRGNSRAEDRIDLLKKFLEVFPKERIKILLGDREFIGPRWIEYLQKEKIPYCFRIKEEGQYLENRKGRFIKAKAMFRTVGRSQTKAAGVIKIGKKGEVISALSATRSVGGELLVVMHSEELEAAPCESYQLRWSIECLFKGMKSNGFNVEDTHLTDAKRIETMLSVLMIAFCYAYDWGQMQEAPKLKKHGFPQHSLFRMGLDSLRRALLNLNQFIDELSRYFENLFRRKTFYAKSFVP